MIKNKVELKKLLFLDKKTVYTVLGNNYVHKIRYPPHAKQKLFLTIIGKSEIRKPSTVA